MSGLLKTLAAKPWLSGEDERGAAVQIPGFDLPAPKVGLRVFLLVVASLFMLSIVGYRLRMVYDDWAPLREPAILWLGTAFLALGSVFLEWARRAHAARQAARARQLFHAGGICSILFLTGQLAAWQQLQLAGLPVSSNPASSFFYLLTGLHGLHILGGLVAWGRGLAHLQAGGDPREAGLSIDLCALYWHFLLAIWGVLFYLLLQS